WRRWARSSSPGSTRAPRASPRPPRPPPGSRPACWRSAPCSPSCCPAPPPPRAPPSRENRSWTAACDPEPPAGPLDALLITELQGDRAGLHVVAPGQILEVEQTVDVAQQFQALLAPPLVADDALDPVRRGRVVQRRAQPAGVAM